MEFKNKTQGQVQVQAADILMDMPVETMQRLLRQMERSEYYADKSEFPGLAIWFMDVLNWKIQMSNLLHDREIVRLAEKAQEHIDELAQEGDDPK